MRRHSRALFAVAALSAFLLLAPLAQAAPKGVAAFFGNPSGANSTLTGEFSAIQGIAVNTTGVGPADPGTIYTVDAGNNRIQRFSVLGEFERMWGKDTIKAGATVDADLGDVFEICTHPADCKAGASGSLGGEFSGNARGIAVDQQSGNVYVVERSQGNATRVQAFTGDGQFLWALGKDVVSTGPGDSAANEQQTVAVRAAAGTFALTFAGQTATGIDFNATPAALEAKLNALSTIGGVGGSVTVSGGPGDATGSTPYTITFGGTLGGDDVAALSASATGLSGGILTSGVTLATPVPGGAFEVCANPAVCKAAAMGARGGEFGNDGSSGASFGGGSGIAVVPTDSGSPLPNAGNVLVTDRGNNRVQEFTAAGSFIRAFGWDVVDGVANPGAPGDDTLAPINQLEICNSAATCKAGASGSGPGQFGGTSTLTTGPNRVAVDSTGAIYTVENGANFRLQKFTPAGSDLTLAIVNSNVGGSGPALDLNGTSSSNTPMDVAIGPDEHVFVVKGYPAGIGTPTSLVEERRVVELDSAGAYVETHASRAGIPGVLYLALNADSEEIYMTSSAPAGGGQGVYILGASAPPTVSMGVGGVGTHTAQLNGLVNPGGPGTPIGFTATYRFEYRKVGAPSWTALGADKDIGNGFATIPVSAALGDLEANTAYEAKLVASKRFSGVAAIETTPEIFVTPASQPEIDAAYATERGATTATLNARINPNGEATTYRFEYGTTPAYGTTVPVPDANAGSGTSSQVFSEAIADLAPETTYHFRVIAANANGTAKSADRTFTTRATVQPPEERGYELVSPPDKVGGSGLSIWYAGVGSHGNVGVAAIEADRFSPLTYYGASLADGGFSYGSDASLAERTPSGWVNKPAFNRLGGVDAPEFAKIPLINAASDDLSLTAWGANNQMRVFEGQVPNAGGHLLREWGSGHWEVFAPFAPEQGGTSFPTVAIAPDGGYALAYDGLRGVAGPGDPTAFSGEPGDQEGNETNNVYIDDVTAGLSDTFPGEGIRSLVNVCTGAGAERTAIPSLDAGKIVAAECPAALPGRDARLISTRGASLTLSSVGGGPAGVISDDGSRVFFMAPDHGVASNLAPCTGVGAVETKCPPQFYVRQRNSDGSITVRWISQSAIAGQDASLMSAAVFAGATPDGDKAYFRTASPLTADDPNGGPQVPGGVRTGTPNPSSTDLYMYDFPDDPDADIGEGTLTRISAGPSGAGDANASSLRTFGEDGSRAYFTTAAPLAGVPAPSSGTITTPSGAPNQGETYNLYAYDANLPLAQRWRFVAQLPASGTFSGCASTGSRRFRQPLESGSNGTGLLGSVRNEGSANCVRTSADGSFLTFFTNGRLTADDPDSVSGDLYAYDATTDELTRISAPQGGAGGSYVCITDNESSGLGAHCNGDPSVGGLGSWGTEKLNLITNPTDPTDRTAFFESASRLVPEDENDVYDVYQWRNGELSLLSTGAAGAEPALYQGTDRTGKNVYISTRDRLTWEDYDSVLDVYSAHVDGGFPEPIEPPPCDVLADGCQGAPSAAPAASGASSAAISGQGNVVEKPKPRRCRKGQVRRRGKCVAKKQKRAKRTANKNRRAGK